MTNLFIDTNILLHFKTFDEINWKKITADETTLIIAPIILDEIDKHKNHQNTRTARRAKMIADKFEQYIDGKPGKVNVQFITKRPPAKYFEQNQLDPKHQDDCLLAAILQYKDEQPEATVRLVTDDLGAKMRAATLDIQTIKLSADLRLPEQAGEQGKQIEKLKAEVNLLKDRIPKIKLTFQGGLTVLKHEVIVPKKTLEDHQKAEMSKIKREIPLMQLGTSDTIGKQDNFLTLIEKLSGGGLTDDRKQKYNTELEQYYQEYQTIIRQEFNYAIERLHLVKLEFELVNEGNTPAEDIDVWIHLPDGFEVVNKYPKKPKKPEPPFRPKNNYDLQPFGTPMLNLDFSLAGARPAPPDPDRPTIKKTNSYEITFHCSSVKHAMLHRFNYILLKYTALKKMQSFELDYRLIAANVPQPVAGKLNVVFERNT